MRVSREKAAENRERIVDAAAAQFRAKGFGGIGVADIMRAADLTHGGFYGHFGSKEDLAAEASRRALSKGVARWETIAAAAPDGPFAALVTHYLTPRHRDRAADGCAFATLGAEAAREGKAVRSAFADGLRPMLRILAKAIPGRSKAARRRKAVAAMSEMVGAMILARAVDDPALSDEILAAARLDLLAASDT